MLFITLGCVWCKKNRPIYGTPAEHGSTNACTLYGQGNHPILFAERQ